METEAEGAVAWIWVEGKAVGRRLLRGDRAHCSSYMRN
jgi:hypothetical protein